MMLKHFSQTRRSPARHHTAPPDTAPAKRLGQRLGQWMGQWLDQWLGASAMAPILASALVIGLGSTSAEAETTAPIGCQGRNLMAEMEPATRSALEIAAHAVPYPSGNFFELTRGAQKLTVLGTYHLDDSRHDPIEAAVRGRLQAADLLLVEAGRAEERELALEMQRNPGLATITDGPDLKERYGPETWERLASAFKARGIPPFIGARFRPWYATVTLGIAPCAIALVKQQNGLDFRLMREAETRDIPVEALEPAITLIELFASLTPEQEREMIEGALAGEAFGEDMSTTLADLYFQGEVRQGWELMRHMSLQLEDADPAQVERELALMEDLLMERRNRAWIPMIEGASSRNDHVFIAFGALHLSGKAGVLALLEAEGWQITPLDLPHPVLAP